MADRRISETLYEDLKRLAVYCGKMTRRGIRIDREVVNRLETGIQEKKGSLFESEMKLRTPKCKKLTKHWLTPFNPNAPKQIKEYFDSVGVELKAKKGSLTSKATICATLERELKKAKVPFTTDKVLGLPEIAEDWDGTLAEPVEYLLRLAEYKGAGKGLKSWFADEYIDTESFVHPRFIVPGTATGRLASANPNFQNLPKRGFGALVRAALVPRDSKLKFVRADKAQLELRVCLHYAGVDAPPFDAFSWLVEKAHGKFDAAAAKFSMKPRDIAKSVGHACLTPEHEVLTPQGWIRINAWDGDAIAEWRESGDIAFVVPRAYHRYQVDESLTWLHTRGLSQVVTNNHKLPVEITGTWNGKTYRTLHRQLPTELAHCGRIPVAGKLDARETFDDLTLRRAVCIQADGSRRGSGTWRFRFKRPRKIARFRELWPDAEFTWRGGVAEVTVDYTSPLLSLEKVLTWEFLRTSVRQKRLVCEEALYWDGTRRASTGQDCYTNSCRQSLDVLQTLAHLSGRQALLRNGSVGNFPGSTRRVDKLSFNVRRYAVVKTLERESVHYTGEVFCFTTSSGFFLVRHNNRISVTGNSNYLEGLMVFDDVELGSERRQTEIKEGALLVFDGKNGRPKWEYRGGIVCFSGANLAERLFGEKTRKARRDALAIQEIYFDAFPAIRAWHMELSHEVERSHSVRSITGRHMYLYG
ncbi:MAG: DNA polymerase, partial [Bryobacteraceae bacterium]